MVHSCVYQWLKWLLPTMVQKAMARRCSICCCCILLLQLPSALNLLLLFQPIILIDPGPFQIPLCLGHPGWRRIILQSLPIYSNGQQWVRFLLPLLRSRSIWWTRGWNSCMLCLDSQYLSSFTCLMSLRNYPIKTICISQLLAWLYKLFVRAPSLL